MSGMKGAAGPLLATLGVIVGFAATSAPSAAQDAAAKVQKGRELFDDYGCGSCHTLADAGATGHVGPGLDGNTKLSEAFVADRIKNGEGAMPAFGQLSPEDIATLSSYVMQASKK